MKSFVAALLLAAASAATEAAPAPGRPDIVLVTVDSLRTDRLGCYTGGARRTPVIDALAARGVRFARAYASSVSTVPGTASLLTGLYPARHGLRHDLGGRLAAGARPVADLLRDVGYRTAAVIGTFHLDSDRGLDLGFDTYDDAIEGLRKASMALSKERRAGPIVERGLALLEAGPKDRPRFLWLNFHDPHYDYDPPEPEKSKYKESPYDGEVAYVDNQLGGLINGLRARKKLETTILILTAPHGEALGERGESGHGVYLYENTIRVPLVLAGPGVTARGVIDRAVSLADLAPTIAELAGLRALDNLDGRSFKEALLGEAGTASPGGAAGPSQSAEAGASPAAASSHRFLYSEAAEPHQAYGWAPLYATLDGDWKVVYGARAQAFDLGADPKEQKPLESSPTWVGPLLFFGRKHLADLDPKAAEKRRIRDKVEALGMPWSNSPICVEKESWPDPRDPERVALQPLLFRAGVDIEQGLYGRASQEAQEILTRDPANFRALEILLLNAIRGSSIAQSADTIELLQCNYPWRGAGYHFLGHYYLSREQAPKAIGVLELFAEIEPWNEEPDYDLAIIYAGLGKKDEAIQHLARAIKLGAEDLDFIRADSRLSALRADPRFQDLMGPLRSEPEKPH